MVLTLAFAIPLSAQLCRANPPLGANGSANLGFGVSFFDGGKTYSGGALFGDRVFGGGSFSYTDFDDTTLSLKNVSGQLGMDVGDTGDTSVCPVLSVGYGFGLEILGIDVTQWTVAPGPAVGFRSEISPTMTVVPALRGSFVYEHATADAGVLGEESDSQTYGVLGGGLGFLFNDRLSLTPSVAVPVGLDDSDPSFGIAAAIAVGGD